MADGYRYVGDVIPETDCPYYIAIETWQPDYRNKLKCDRTCSGGLRQHRGKGLQAAATCAYIGEYENSKHPVTRHQKFEVVRVDWIDGRPRQTKRYGRYHRYPLRQAPVPHVAGQKRRYGRYRRYPRQQR